MLLNDIIQPIPKFAAYNFRLDLALQNPTIAEQSQDFTQFGNVYSDNFYQYLNNLTYADLLRFWFTIYRLEIDINYSVNSTNTEQSYNSATDTYEYISQNTNVSLQKNIIYHFTKPATTADPNPDIFLPNERTCVGFNGQNTTSIIPTISPNVIVGLRQKEIYSLTAPKAVLINNDLALQVNFWHSNVSPSPLSEFYDRNLIYLGQTSQQYDLNGDVKDPVKYIDFSATWETSQGETIKEWTGGKIPIGQQGWIEGNEPYQSKQTNNAQGTVNYKFISFDCEQ